MRILSVILLFFIVPPVFSQYALGKRTIVFFDNSRSNRAISTEVYYPATLAGNGTPLATGTEKFPVIVFGHGFVMPVTAYTWLADSLVKYGFIVALPSTESSFSPSHDNFGKDLAFLCQRITSLNDSTASFLFGRVSSKSAAGGHSMGGGCSFLAMNQNTAINALFNFAAAETTPSAKTAALSVQKPSLIFSGSSDCIVAPAQQLEMYNNIPYTCKTYINITNALHCQFGNNDATCALGQLTSGCNSSSITPAIVFEKICYLLVPYLKYYLKADCAAGVEYQSHYNAINGVTKLQFCSADPAGCVVTGINDPAAEKMIRVIPNPITGQSFQILSEKEKILAVYIRDMSGRLVSEHTGSNTRTLRVELRQKGVLIVQVRTINGVVNKRILVQ